MALVGEMKNLTIGNKTYHIPIPTKTSDLTNDSNFMSGMTILSYGTSTWNDFLTAYKANHVVYCRASSNANPASGSQTRMAFMAYVSDATNPTNVEFQYYRSVSSHTSSQQGDQVYVYKLTSANAWTVTVREASVKIKIATNNEGIKTTYSSGTVSIGHANSVTAQTTQAIYPIKIDAQGHISEYGSAVNITDEKVKTNMISGSETQQYFLTFGNATTSSETKFFDPSISVSFDPIDNTNYSNLRVGWNSGGIAKGQLQFIDTNYIGTLNTDALTIDRTWTLPDKTGTIALTSDVPDITGKQDTLVSGTNIKTINNTSLLGSGDITIASSSKNIWYGTCTTSSATTNKVVTTTTGDFQLEAGNMVRVWFSQDQAASSAKLVVDNTTETYISTDGVSGILDCPWRSQETIDFVYNGTYFIISDAGKASTDYYGVTKLSSSTSSTSTSLAATPSAVKAAYDLANSKVSDVQVNGTSVVSSGTASISTSSTPVANTIAKFDSSAHMNSADMTAQEISAFVSTVPSGFDNLTNLSVTNNITAGGDVTDGTGTSISDLAVNYIIEEDSTGNWHYRKWNNGKIEAWGIYNNGSTIPSTWVTGWYYKDFTITIPTGIFSATPTNVVATNNGTDYQYMVYSAIPISSTQIAIRVVKPSSNSATPIIAIYVSNMV